MTHRSGLRPWVLALAASCVGLGVIGCGSAAGTTTQVSVSAATPTQTAATSSAGSGATTVSGAAGTPTTGTAGTTNFGSTPTLHSDSLSSGGHTRTYLLQTPRGTHARMGLMIVLHGADDTAQNTYQSTDYASVAAAKGFLVAFPQGYDDTWNEGAGGTPARRAGVNDVAFIAAMIRQIESRYSVDRANIAAAGFSNGALMVQYLGCELASTIDLIQPIEGEIPVTVASRCHPSQSIGVLEVHGTADTSIPYAGGRFYGVGGGTTVLSAPATVAKWAQLDGCSASPANVSGGGRKTTTYSRCRQGRHVVLVTIDGGTHNFPDDAGQLLANAM